MQELNVEHSPCETRHTTATLLKKYGADELYKKRILGHAVTDITDAVYTHIEIEKLQEIMELIP